MMPLILTESKNCVFLKLSVDPLREKSYTNKFRSEVFPNQTLFHYRSHTRALSFNVRAEDWLLAYYFVNCSSEENDKSFYNKNLTKFL